MHTAFAGENRWDRNAFLGLAILVWVGVLSGFGPEIQQHISDAGFARLLADPLIHRLGFHFPVTIVALYGAPDGLIVGLGAYDLVTRKRLHPAYIAGIMWVFAVQILAAGLWTSPAWKPIAIHLLGH